MNSAEITQASISHDSVSGDITLTPSAADAWQQCSYRAIHSSATQTNANGSLRRGILIHNILRLDMQRRLAGQVELAAEELVMRGCNDQDFKHDAQFIEMVIACVDGTRRFLLENGLTPLAPERYVRSAYRTLVGHPDLRLRFSGRIDLVARNNHGGMTVLDYKTGQSIPSGLELAVMPSSFIYTYLGRCLLSQDSRIGQGGADDVEVVQVLPHLGTSSSVVLTPDEVQARVTTIREMVVAMVQQQCSATPGDYCAYCSLIDTCPARPKVASWEYELF